MNTERKGNVLVIDAASRSTKVGWFVDGVSVFEETVSHDPEKLAAFPGLMAQDNMRRDAVLGLLKEKGVRLEDVQLIMARGGLFAPVHTGVYKVNRDMRDVLQTCRDGYHACNLSAVIADDIAELVTEARPERPCFAYIADAPMADEMLPECRIGGLPEFPRRAFFHDLNSRAALNRYLAENGREMSEVTAIVAHLGHGITVTLHHHGRVVDTNNGLGGDGPFTMERAGTCPAFPLVEMCFSGKYTESEVKMKLMGQGGAMAYFGTSDMGRIIAKAEASDHDARLFLDAYCLNVAKYIASAAATVSGNVDAVILTGGDAAFEKVTSNIAARVRFIAPVSVYPGEHNVESLAANGYAVLAGTVKVHRYDKNAIVQD